MRTLICTLMRTLAQALLLAMLTIAAGGPALGQDRTTNCRPLAERGRIWADCCNQSFARDPRRTISRQRPPARHRALRAEPAAAALSRHRRARKKSLSSAAASVSAMPP